jgi:hypothetical protein
LIENLNAQTPNNSSNPKMEQVDKNDILQVRTFMSDLNKTLSQYNIQITLSPEQEKLAINGVGRMDSRGKKEAIKLIVNLITTGKVTPKSTIQKKVPVQDRDEVIGFVLDAIEQAYDRDSAKLENIMANADLYTEYETRLNEVTNTFKIDRSNNTKQLESEIAQNEKETKQEAIKAENALLKLYQLDPQSEKTRTIAQEGKNLFKKINYQY